ncbi:oxysterol binding family protein, member 4 [Dictyostelium discoideum AX4]|uniref:Oxysterol-binding protein 4 n=1 Tax=Dictyostelium discoideum TaxID=44689 RepID=OSB4_DICDI|nr:oxysterol binding family protein, member 4 [Dictyostelium discoideum AX4]Q86KG4.2 RecName: Full=Oxysterol-binding protein 4; AltName: Full=OSBPd [Dictyostelium discoideum]EAL71173.1 oxysterol binding family protein, member 4 [Dictyostelium discoideum AX4]|eukprot:XP_645109.1 oxysterol binding family protein, member 4 [Dictyostelium discoideum AX4]
MEIGTSSTTNNIGVAPTIPQDIVNNNNHNNNSSNNSSNNNSISSSPTDSSQLMNGEQSTSPPSPPIEEVLEEEPRNLLISLLSELKIGVDLSRVPLPTFILEPRSLLEKFTDNMIHGEILCNLSKLESPMDRMHLITKWYLSAFHYRKKGLQKPYNPILGEIFRTRWEFKETNSNCIMVAEQISHHPPVSCIYLSNRKDGYTMTGTINPRSKFLGNSMAVIVDGSSTLTLLGLQEEYVITFPTAVARGIIFGTLLTEIVGNSTISCKQTNIKVEMDFKAKPMFGGEYNVVCGKIKKGNETTHTFNGKWDKKVEITLSSSSSSSKKKNGSTNDILWDCNDAVKTQMITRQISEQEEFESQRLWQKVSHAIIKKNQKDATFEKNKLEDEQRKRVKDRKENNIEWEPRLFKKVNDQWIYKYQNHTLYDQNEPKEIETDGIIHFEGTLIKKESKQNLVEKCGASENEIIV